MAQAPVIWNGMREFMGALTEHLEENIDNAANVILAQAEANAGPGGSSGLQQISGDLSSTMFMAQDEPLSRIVGSPMSYAKVQELGGPGGVWVDDKMAMWAWAKFKETGLNVYKAIALRKGTFIIPPRPFLRPALLDQSENWLEKMMRPMP